MKPIEKLRRAALKRGVNGIRSIGRMFRLYDDDGSKQLNYNEFKTGCQDYSADLSDAELKQVFDEIDTGNDGSINYEEFLRKLRPPMSKNRIALIDKAFAKMDKTGDGKVTVADLKDVYDVQHHPKFKSGEWTKKQVLEEFMKSYQVGSSEIDEIITKEEFVNYYAGVSASIDQDVYFDYMMRQTWKL